MKAIQLTIHNFRSIRDATIQCQPCGLLVGANNSGKSTVIDCIRCFYEKGTKFNYDRDFPKGNVADQDSWVEIEFRPSDIELPNLKDEYKTTENTFRVRKYFQTEELASDGKQKSGLYAYSEGELSEKRFYGFKNVGQDKFGNIVYIPAVSKIDEHTKLTGPSALRDLVLTVLTRVMEDSPAYANLKSSFQQFEGSIKAESTPDGVSLATIEQHVTDQISEWGAEFRLCVNPVGVDELIKGLIGHDIFDKALDASQAPASFGQGFQRSLIYALIRTAARFATTKKAARRKEFSPDLTWILFEEPEAFLHPTQVSNLSNDLRELSGLDSTQVLLTTHSPQFATHNIADLPSLCRMHRAGSTSEAYQISQVDLNNILSSNQSELATWAAAGMQIDPDNLRIDMESIKYSLWRDARRYSSFFAERVLLVEGPTETALLSYLVDNGDLQGCRSVYFVDTMGKFNIHRFMRLFEKLGIKHYVLYDGDQGKYGAVDASIQGASNAFTGGIDTFPIDIEDFLGVPKASKPHRKPQHLMLQIASGNVDRGKLSALGVIVKSGVWMVFSQAAI